MITSELLRIRYSLAARLIFVLVLAEVVFSGLLFAFLPALTNGLIALNQVIPNATDADQFSDAQLHALSLANRAIQDVVIDLLGNSGTGIGFPALAALLLGALTITTEHRRGSLTTSVLAEPRRLRLLAAKQAALAVMVLATAVLLIVLRGLLLALGLAVQDQPFLLDQTVVLGLWLRGALTLLLYAGIGFSLGLLVRSPVAVILVTGAAVIVESVLRPITTLLFGAPNPALFLPFGLVPDISGTNPLATLTGAEVIPSNVAPAVAVAVLASWAILITVVAGIRFIRGDIPDRQ